MKILVLMKQVANKDAILRINKDSTWIEEADLSFEVNESDGYALEEALTNKGKSWRRSCGRINGPSARQERN
jgi:electron transfer flavoprotein alpha/beta subunit